MRRAGKVWTAIVLLFLYAPMIVLFVGSFNDGRDLSEFEASPSTTTSTSSRTATRSACSRTPLSSP